MSLPKNNVQKKLKIAAAWHEKQAEYFLPFGPSNALTKFHSETARAIRAAILEIGGMKK